jgi:hypothetical protein
VADRVASLRTGSTHKVYRGWRFAVVMQHGHPQPGTTLFSISVDPAQLATSRSRYALVQLATPAAMVLGDPVAFSWSASSIGTADPFADAHAHTRRDLEAAGWTPDATVPTHFTKPDPTLPVGVETTAWVVRSNDGLDVAKNAAEPSASEPEHRPMVMTPPPAVTGLDGWETDGGAVSAGSSVGNDCWPRLPPSMPR